MRRHIDSALKILTKVFADGTYSNMAFYGENVSDMTTKIVYGVLEENVKLEYILSQLIQKKPQNMVYLLLKIGAYCLLNLTDVPAFAIVSECVEVAKKSGKSGVGGFVNAVLKKVSVGAYTLPEEGDDDYLSITYSKPKWFVDKLISQYGYGKALEIVSAKSDTREHARVNLRLAALSDVIAEFDKAGEEVVKSKVGGLLLNVSNTARRLFDKGLITYQSPSSMTAVNALNPSDGAAVLDLCSAPGGKAVYMAELCPQSVVVACDIHPHRISLIQKYKQRMHSPNIKAVLNDACVFNPDWEGAFDFVLVDAPCSCFGTFNKHPDVFLSKSEDDIKKLSAVQKSIVLNAARYLKDGGVMVYSTCTLFKEENDDVVDYIVNNTDMRLERIVNELYDKNDGIIRVLPHCEWDGFFIARFKKDVSNTGGDK